MFYPGALIMLVVLALTGAQVADAQTIVSDSGFDSQGSSVPQYCYSSNCPSGSWSMLGLAGFVRQGNGDWPAPVPVSSPIVVFLQNTSEISQPISVPVTQPYVVSFYIATRSDHGSFTGAQSVAVELAGQQIFLKAMNSGQEFRRFVSNPITLPAGSSHVLRFRGLGNQAMADVTAFIDNVAVVSASSTIKYTYDAQGRLVQVDHAGGVNAGTQTRYGHDRASNRTNVTVIKPQ